MFWQIFKLCLDFASAIVGIIISKMPQEAF